MLLPDITHLHHVFKYFLYQYTFSNFHKCSLFSCNFLLSRLSIFRSTEATELKKDQSEASFNFTRTQQTSVSHVVMYITSFSEKEIFCLYLFFSPESSSLMVFSVWLGNHAFVSFLGYSADIPCHVLCSDRAAGKWETLFLKEKTRQVAWPLKKGKKNARLLKTTNSSSTRWFAPKQCILGV